MGIIVTLTADNRRAICLDSTFPTKKNCYSWIRDVKETAQVEIQ